MIPDDRPFKFTIRAIHGVIFAAVAVLGILAFVGWALISVVRWCLGL